MDVLPEHRRALLLSWCPVEDKAIPYKGNGSCHADTNHPVENTHRIWSVLMDEIESCSSCGDWDGLQTCYKVVKWSIGGDVKNCQYEAFMCSLELLDGCLRVCDTAGIRESVVVGALLASGISLSSCASDKALASRVYAGGYLDTVLKSFERSIRLFEASGMPLGWEQYGMTLFKSMSKTALGFLTHGMEDACFRVGDGCIVCIMKYCQPVVPKGLTALSAMSQHVSSDKMEWSGLLAKAMNVGSPDDAIEMEKCLSCCRRLLSDSVERGDIGRTCGEDAFNVYSRMLSSVTCLYSECRHGDLHSGLVAVGVVAKAICSGASFGSKDSIHLADLLCKALDSMLRFGAEVDDAPMVARQDALQCHMKDLIWLTRVLYTSGVSEVKAITDVMRYSMLWGSVMCSIQTLYCTQDDKDKIAKELIHRVCRLSCVSRASEIMENIEYCTILRKVVWCLEDTGLGDHLPSLLSTLVKNLYLDSEGTDSFTTLKFALSFEADVKKKRISKLLWLDVLKYSIASLASIVETYPKLSLKAEAEVSHISDIVRTQFNPGKTPDAFLDVLLVCHCHKTTFPGLFSAEQFTEDLQAILDETKTKIGHKRIDEVQSIIDMLRIEDSVNELLDQAQKSHKTALEKRREMLRKDPSVIHSEGWAYSDVQKQIEHVLEIQISWKNIISKASEAIEKVRRASTISCSTEMVEQLEALLNLHRPGMYASKQSSFWETVAHPNVDEDFNLENCMRALAEGAQDKNASELNMVISKNQAVRGHIHSALFHAMEWHKYVSPVVHHLQGDISDGSTIDARWWTSASEYLACCSWLGFLFSVAGLYEESTQSYNEGLRLACVLGSPALCFFFTVSLAEVHMVGGDVARFQSMLNQAGKIENSLDDVDRQYAPVACNFAHLQVLRAHIDKTMLEFRDAKSKITVARALLAKIDGSMWYRARVFAAAAFEDMLILLDEESSASSQEIGLRIEKVFDYWAYDTLLLGAPFSLLCVLQAQMLSESCLEPNQSKDARIWVLESNKSYEKYIDCIQNLWNISLRVRCSPFCQRVVFLLMAPLCASVGCKYAAIALLHSASNPTIQFQKNLVFHTKVVLKAFKTNDIDQLLPHNSTGTALDDHLVFSCLNSTEWDGEDIESKAEALISSWTEKISQSVICGIAVYNSTVYGPSNLTNDKLVLFRLRKGQIPLMVEIPSPEIESSHPIHLLHGTKSCGAIELLENKLQDILKRSNSNMRSILPTSSEAEQRSWWEERVDLDHNMQRLLQELHSDWIGPWRCLFTDVGHGADTLQDEVKLVTSLLAREKTSLSQADRENLSRVLQAARQGNDLEDTDGDFLSEAFDELHLGESLTPKPHLNRKVSFKSPCRTEASDSLHCPSEAVSVLRAGVEDVSIDMMTSLHISEREDANPIDTPAIHGGNTPSRAKSVSRRKHKSRLPQMHSFMTPNPRRVLVSRNSMSDVLQTPKTSIKQSRDVCVTPLLDKTRTMPHMQRSRSTRETDGEDQSVVLILDHAIQSLPWESSFRMFPDVRWEFYRIPSLPAFIATTSRRETISVDSCYYAINPSGDLVSTQKTFEDWFKGLKGWKGRSGSPPNASELSKALQEHDLFVYCGHGGGEQYLPLSRLRSLESCASSLLMGCSSGKLKRNNRGAYEASGVILAYTLAGCPAVVGNLWDVTDKDIDRYCHEMISKMISSTSRGGQTSIGHVVHNSRHACKLPFLIGAAPVCYGIPATFT